MEKLKETFRKNDLQYTLIKRNELVAMYGVGGTYTNKIIHYEVCKIMFNKEHIMQGNLIPAGESIPGNERFGTEGSHAYTARDYKIALEYFDELTTIIKTRAEAKLTYTFRGQIVLNTFHPLEV